MTNAGKVLEYNEYNDPVTHDDELDDNDLVVHEDVVENNDLVTQDEEIENDAVLE